MTQLACPPRFATPRRADRPTLGPKVAAVAKLLGTPLMPWQRYVADVSLEVDAVSGMLVYREVDLTVPRQSGKTTLMLAGMVHRALGFGGRQGILYTAQRRIDARKKWEDEHVKTLEDSPFAGRFRVRRTTGNESIQWQNGSWHGIVAPGETSGHGPTLDLGVIDEAWAQKDSRLEQAFKPAMITRSSPQLWAISTAGKQGQSPYLWGKVEAGRERALGGATEGVAYFEWSDDDGDPGLVETWMRCMPALRSEANPQGTVSVEAVAADFASMELAEFVRAYLNRWEAASRVEPWQVIAEAEWDGCVYAGSKPSKPVCLAFDVPPERSSGSVGAAAMDTTGGWRHVELVEHRPGTGWMVDRIVELVARHQPSWLVCDAAGPAGSLLNGLADKGVAVKVANFRDHAQACGAFYDDVTNDGPRLRHIGQGPLSAAVGAATKRAVGDAWLWSRQSAVDISPLVAVTLARWASTLAPPRRAVTEDNVSVW